MPGAESKTQESQSASPGPRKRDPEVTRGRILEAAIQDFATRGLAGARIDDIAAASGANKRMIYHYFGNKTALFQAVLEQVYMGLCEAVSDIDVETLPPREALSVVVQSVWGFYRDHPEAITLLNSENLHEARHIRSSATVQDLQAPFEGKVARMLTRGQQAGVFVADVDPVDLYISIVGLVYYFRSNRHTLSVFFDRDLSDEAVQEKWCDHVERLIAGFLTGTIEKPGVQENS